MPVCRSVNHTATVSMVTGSIKEYPYFGHWPIEEVNNEKDFTYIDDSLNIGCRMY
jgi:hypothetical protein